MAPARAERREEHLRVGIVGLGKMGLLHWQTWRRFQDVDVTALVDTNPALAALAQEQGIPFFRSAEELVGQVDAAVIATPPGQHVACALPLLRAGIHCLVEKPIALELSDGERLVAAAARHGAMLAVGHCERFNPGVQRVRAAAAAAPSRIEVFRMARPQVAAGARVDVVQDLMVHDLDWVTDLLGQMPHSLKVRESRWLDGSLSYVSCELGFAESVQVMLTASRLETAARRQVIVRGGRGQTRAISLSSVHDAQVPDPLTLQARAFVDALEGRVSAIATGGDALRVTELAHWIRTHCEQADAYGSVC